MSDEKLRCNQAGCNYRGLSGRPSWARPPQTYVWLQTQGAMLQGVLMLQTFRKLHWSAQKSEDWSDSESRENPSNWMCHFHLQSLGQLDKEGNKEGGAARGTLLRFTVKKKKWAGTCSERLLHSYFPPFPLVLVVLCCS